MADQAVESQYTLKNIGVTLNQKTKCGEKNTISELV